MKPDYIKRFERLGIGMFVHFGLYSVLGKGEWIYSTLSEKDKKRYFEELPKRFNPKKDWAKRLVRTAKGMGAKYITITTRHHDGFSLYDTCGLSDFDAPHALCQRDLIRELVGECNAEGIIPFFYHTLLDWHHPEYDSNFPKYLQYLRDSVELLCRNYGKIGGFWFDGSWSKPDLKLWEFDKLYALIRKYQPEAMIINNTGLSDTGAVSHPEIDSVTFERGKPRFVSNEDGKDRAGEMCDSVNDHWGYAKDDLSTKSVSQLINSLLDCRKHGCNFLLNAGPMPTGELSPLDRETLLAFGKWVKKNARIVYDCKPSEIKADNADLYEDGEYFYAVIRDVPMSANENVVRQQNRPEVVVHTDKKITNLMFLDNRQKVKLGRARDRFPCLPFQYGTSLFARVARFKLK